MILVGIKLPYQNPLNFSFFPHFIQKMGKKTKKNVNFVPFLYRKQERVYNTYKQTNTRYALNLLVESISSKQ